MPSAPRDQFRTEPIRPHQIPRIQGVQRLRTRRDDPCNTREEGRTMDPTYRLRTATRLHFLLLRRYGQHIDVSLLLKSKARDHDGLWLCRATGDHELIALARLLALANRAHAREEARLREQEAAIRRAAPSASGRVTQPMAWRGDTTGFGVSKPQELAALPAAEAPASSRWINPLNWLKGDAVPANA